MYKKKIIWIIDSLGKGGAETLLVNLLPSIKDKYIVHLVVLSKVNDFGFEFIQQNTASVTYLDNKGKKSFITHFFLLRKFIKQKKPDLVRSDLVYSSLLARLATPKNIKLYFAIHSLLSMDSFSKSKVMLFAEKLTYKKDHNLIAVSEAVLKDYDHSVGVKGKSYVLKNYISKDFYLNKKINYSEKIKKVVCVGNIKEVKNYQLLINTFKKYPQLNCDYTIDIYGGGTLMNELKKDAANNNLSIIFKGPAAEVFNVLKYYDAYLIPSLHEGFGISLAEAMTMGLPVIASDIPVLKETTNGLGYFFDPNSPVSLAEVLSKIKNLNDAEMDAMYCQTKKAQEYALDNYSEKTYLNKLEKIYNS